MNTSPIRDRKLLAYDGGIFLVGEGGGRLLVERKGGWEGSSV